MVLTPLFTEEICSINQQNNWTIILTMRRNENEAVNNKVKHVIIINTTKIKSLC